MRFLGKNQANYLVSFKTLVVGLGKAGWEYDRLNGMAAKSHSFSILETEGFELIAGVDLKIEKRKQWADYFNLPTFSDLSLAIKQSRPDLIVISTPISEIFSDLQICLTESNCKILVEKPVAANKKEVILLDRLSKVYKDRILVNLPRLYSLEFSEIKELVCGEVLEDISGNYSGTALNTGLHFISLINQLVPNLTWARKRSEISEVFQIKSSENVIGSIEFNGILEKSNFELFLAFERTSIKYLDGGNTVEVLKEGSKFSLKTSRSFYQLNVYKYIGINGFEAAMAISGLSLIQKSINNLIC